MKMIKSIHILFWTMTMFICLAAASGASGADDSCEPGGDSGVNGVPTIAADVEFTGEWLSDLEWDPDNPTVIERSSLAIIRVKGGRPPYEFSVREDDYWLDKNSNVSTLVTESNEIILYAGSECVSDATVFITDSLGAAVSGVLELATTTVVYIEFKTTGHRLCTVWAPQKNAYAGNIPRNDGTNATFPCTSDSISQWRNSQGTVDVGKKLYGNNHCGNVTRRYFTLPSSCDSSGNPDECSGARKSTGCVDVDGVETFQTESGVGFGSESHTYSIRSGRTPAWSGSGVDKGLFLMGPRNQKVRIMNIESFTSYAVSYEYSFHGDIEFYDNLGMYVSEVSASERMVVESPLGLLGEMDLMEYDYIDYGVEGWRHRVGITGWSGIITGVFSDNTICQIFSLGAILQEHSWACGTTYLYWGYYPDNCLGAVIGEEEIFGLNASCRTGINGNTTDPRTLGRSPAFEGALRTGIDEIKDLAPQPDPGKLEYYYIIMSILRTP
ncbi:MAG: hypothetical protein GY866_37855, partial [Proteobacteria bacterium]|nr:hypothetical protein [Pseudomonadota bacterium]